MAHSDGLLLHLDFRFRRPSGRQKRYALHAHDWCIACFRHASELVGDVLDDGPSDAIRSSSFPLLCCIPDSTRLRLVLRRTPSSAQRPSAIAHCGTNTQATTAWFLTSLRARCILCARTIKFFQTH